MKNRSQSLGFSKVHVKKIVTPTDVSKSVNIF